MQPPTALLLTNLGTPAAATERAVRTYLEEFLSDPLVVNLPGWLWQPLLRGIILKTRPRKTARLYQDIWTTDGSPLLANSTRLVADLAPRLASIGLDTYLAMRYPVKSLEHVVKQIQRREYDSLLLFPQFPQYSESTSGSVCAAVAEIVAGHPWPRIDIIRDFHDHPAYITALAHLVKNYWQDHGRGERLLLSYHGLPETAIRRGDPYLQQCLATSELLRGELRLSANDVTTAFQSRFGPSKWTGPAIGEVLAGWGKQGIKRVDVLCPGFTCDCLETLEEIAIREHQRFLRAGGKEFHYIPCLNHNPKWIDALAEIVQDHIRGGGTPRTRLNR